MRSYTRTVNAARGDRLDDVLTRLRDGVETLLADHAYSELSVDRLATAAGLSRSSFYRYVPDKSELLQRLSASVDAESSRVGLDFWRLPGTAPRSELSSALLEFVDLCWQTRLIRQAALEATAYDPVIRSTHDATVAAAISLVRDHIDAGRADGWVRPDLDGADTAAWLVHMTDRGLVTVVGTAERDRLPQIAASLEAVVWFTLYEGHRDPAGTGRHP